MKGCLYIELEYEDTDDIQHNDWVIFRMENTPAGKTATFLRRFRHPELLKPIPFVPTTRLQRAIRYLTLRPVTFFKENSRNFAYSLEDIDWNGKPVIQEYLVFSLSELFFSFLCRHSC